MLASGKNNGGYFERQSRYKISALQIPSTFPPSPQLRKSQYLCGLQQKLLFQFWKWYAILVLLITLWGRE
jgi:hypothetical protein